MKKASKQGDGKVKEKEVAYLTKRATASAAKKGFEEAAKETIAVMGYNVVAKDGWVVKVDKNGNVIEKIAPIEGYNDNTKLQLD